MDSSRLSHSGHPHTTALESTHTTAHEFMLLCMCELLGSCCGQPHQSTCLQCIAQGGMVHCR